MNATARLSTRIGFACSREDSRYSLADAAMVRIPTAQNPDHAAAMATDGRILAVCTGCSLTGADVAIVPAKIASAAPKGTDRSQGLLTVGIGNGNATASGIACPLSDRDPASFPPFADVFPDLGRPADDYAIIGVNVDLLARLADALRAHGKEGQLHLIITLEKTANGPATTRKPLLVIPTSDNQPTEGSAVGLLMPIALSQSKAEANAVLADARRRAKIAIDAARALASASRQPARVDATA